LFLFQNVAYAQNALADFYAEMREKTTWAFSTLNKSQIPTGYLYQYGHLAFDDAHLVGTIQDSNHIQAGQWRINYTSIHSMHIHGMQKLPAPAAMLAHTDSMAHLAHDHVPLAAFWAKFGYIREDAVQTGLLTTNNNRFYDVPNSPM
jgi:hypothetical protein